MNLTLEGNLTLVTIILQFVSDTLGLVDSHDSHAKRGNSKRRYLG